MTYQVPSCISLRSLSPGPLGAFLFNLDLKQKPSTQDITCRSKYLNNICLKCLRYKERSDDNVIACHPFSTDRKISLQFLGQPRTEKTQSTYNKVESNANKHAFPTGHFSLLFCCDCQPSIILFYDSFSQDKGDCVKGLSSKFSSMATATYQR